MKKWTQIKKRLLSNPDVKSEYDKIGPDYELAKALIEARLAKKITQEELAQKSGVKQAYIARLESGHANPTIESINKVAGALDKRIKLVGAS